MILHELRALALREGLMDDPAFESKPVAWIIQLDANGAYLGLKSTCVEVALPEGKKGKPKLQAAMHSIPRRQIRKSNDLSDFLVDKSEYVLAIEPDGKRESDVLVKRSSLFCKMLSVAHTATASSIAGAVLRFLDSPAQRSRCIAELEEVGYASNDLFAFSINNELAHNDILLRKWWAEPKLASGVPDSSRQCLLCAQTKPHVDNHDATFIPGSTSPSSPLVSFNKEAFEKHGLERNDNAPICRSCMTGYFEGLRRLISPRYVSARTGEVVTPQNTRLSGDTTAVYWSGVDDPLLGILGELLYSPQQVRALLLSAHKGQRAHVERERFFCLILSGAQGRVMLRTLHAGTLGELEENLKAYFAALELEGLDKSEPMDLRRLLARLVHQKQRKDKKGYECKLENLPPRLAEQVYLGVLFRTRMPQIVLAAAVARNHAEQAVPPERAALLQLFFQSRKQKEIPIVSLDESCILPGYLLGRLFSTFERAQIDKVRMDNPNAKLNSTLTDRFFGAASTRPGTVFPRLISLSQTHLSKLGERGNYLKKWIGEITDGLGTFPAMLTLEEQGHFALGYYHQRQRFFRKAPAEPAADQPELAQHELALSTQGDPQ